MVLLTVLCKVKWRAQCNHFPLLRSQTQFTALPLAGFYRDLSGGDVNHASAPSPFHSSRWERAAQALFPPLGRPGEGQGNSS